MAQGVIPPTILEFGLIELEDRITFVDVVLWGLRIGLLLLVVVGTIATLWKGTYDARHWFDFFMFGLTIGGVYALIALGYTMVYGVLRLINFAHADVYMVGAFSGYYLANSTFVQSTFGTSVFGAPPSSTPTNQRHDDASAIDARR